MCCSFDVVNKATWIDVNARLGSQCPEVLQLIDLIQSLPCSSSEAERGFSKMKIVKTDWRSKLSDTSLSDLMTVALETQGYFIIIVN